LYFIGRIGKQANQPAWQQVPEIITTMMKKQAANVFSNSIELKRKASAI
jgi:hypothetical protein